MNKTENLMLYVCDKFKDQDTFDSTVFNKVLYYIDNVSYLKTGKQISDFNYVKQRNGPTPKPEQFLSLRDSLIMERKLKIEEVEYFGKTKKVPKNKVKPDLKLFNADEIDTINLIINAFKGINGSDASNYSHKEICWEIASEREELPLYTFLLSSEDVLENDVKWANSVLNAHN